MSINRLLDTLKLEFEACLPDRLITRRWRDRSEYSSVELRQGVLTILFRGESEPDENYYQFVNLLIVASVRLDANAKGNDVEAAELKLLEELKKVSANFSECSLRVLKTVSSGQIEAPDGWVVAECTLGPLLLAGQSVFGDDIDVAPDIKVSRAPDIGVPHVDDYVNVGEL